MSIVILAGVWAIAFGHITLTQSLKMRGKDARLLGLALILVAAYALPHMTGFINGIAPRFILKNSAFASSLDMLTGALAVYMTAWFMASIAPKLRVPSISVSLKR